MNEQLLDSENSAYFLTVRFALSQIIFTHTDINPEQVVNQRWLGVRLDLMGSVCTSLQCPRFRNLLNF